VSTKSPAFVAGDIPKDARVAIVAARFNSEIVDELLLGCLLRLQELGLAKDRVEVHRVPGAFELPVAAKVVATSGRVHAVICLGCVVRGDTPHFDFVAGEAARGIMDVSVETGVPVIFGVLTTNTEEQAKDRAGGKHGDAGKNAAEAAVEMIVVLEKCRGE
jgi:6,7-dimethyl-8-ribityllumazine synthase